MAVDLRKLKDKAAQLAAKAKFQKAADTYRLILKADRRDVASRQRLAEVLRKAGNDGGAITQYQEVADTYAHQGMLIKAIAICKVILEIDPGHANTQKLLADLYASRQASAPAGPSSGASGIRGAVPRAPPAVEEELTAVEAVEEEELPAVEAVEEEELSEAPEAVVELPLPPAVIVPPPPEATAELPPEFDPSLRAEGQGATVFETILLAAEAAREAGVVEDIVIDPDEPIEVVLSELPSEPALPRIPLFSDLSSAAFCALTERLELKRLSPGEAVVHQGEHGDSFYVIASGLFRVERAGEKGEPVVLAHLEEGAFFGEMAILSGEPRAASVMAETEGELLEIRADVLSELCREHPHVAQSLARFYRQRLLANAMATSPLFRPFGPEERKAIMLRFRTRRVTAGEKVITEGQPSDGLYVALSGSLAVLKRKGARDVPAGALREGDVFGEMSCLSKKPASATVVARRPGMLLRLPRPDFDALVVTYPPILELVAQLSDERQQNLDVIVEGGAVWRDDGLLLI